MVRAWLISLGRHLQSWLISLLVFGVLALLFSGQLLVGGALPAADVLRMMARDWLPWVLLAPLIFQFVHRWPLERHRLRRHIPLHLLAALVTLGLCAFWAEVLWPGPQPTRRMPPQESPELRRPRDFSQPPRNSVQPAPGPRGKPPMPLEARLFFGGFRLPVYLALISVAHAFYFYRRSRERELRAVSLESDLARARLDTLRMQLQPHFLFNSLNAIAELVHKNPDKADAMLVALSSFLRLTLDTAGDQEVPLRRELEFAERYLEIEQVRFGDQLQFIRDIADDTLAAPVPSFLLQPLLENAVRHRTGSDTGALRLTLFARRHGEHLLLSVSDNGTAASEETSPLREGIGLGNTRSRLRELYGTAASLETSRAGGGFTVNITLPFRPTP